MKIHNYRVQLCEYGRDIDIIMHFYGYPATFSFNGRSRVVIKIAPQSLCLVNGFRLIVYVAT